MADISKITLPDSTTYNLKDTRANIIGSTDISSIGSTVTSAISTLSTSKAGTSLASTSANGLLRKLSNNTSQYLRGDGTWQTLQNNVTTTTAGYALDARAGKTLQDHIDAKSTVTVGYITYKIPAAIASNSFYTAKFACTPPSGYTTSGITWITKSGSGNGNLLISSFSAGGGGGDYVNITFYNIGSAISANTITVAVDVLYRK